jgi:pyruvate dehydrogenase E2 component (dihydrolipoamide acetyltransferase)
MSDIVMPRLSDSMEEGTILKWLKADGDSVARGEPLAEIETDKATLTYESDAAGVLSIVVAAGETLPIGEVIARLDDGSAGAADAAPADADGGADAAPAEAAANHEASAPAEAEEPAAEAATTAEAEEPAAEAATPAAPEPPAPEASAPAEPAEPEAPAAGGTPADALRPAVGRIKASPLARRIAREMNVDLRLVTGTGPGGRVVKADVEEAAQSGSAAVGSAPPPDAQAAAPQAAAPAAPPAAAPGAATAAPAAAAPPAAAPAAPQTPGETGTAKGDITIQELTRIQQVIARRMAESKATVPEFTLRTEIDMEGCVELRAQLKAIGGDVPSYNDMVVRACALALREYPRANGSYKDGKFELHSRVNVGVAVAATDALVVPTIFDADRKSLREIARETRAAAERVRAGTVTPPELSGGTFTVSNLGMFGVTDFTAVINPPQAAILAVGALAPRAVVRDGQLVARNTMAVVLACDHRILYGADAAQFLARIRALLEQPLALAF